MDLHETNELRDLSTEAPRALQPSGWPIPKGYSNGMTAQGRLVVTGGVVGWDETGAFPGDFIGQIRRTLENIRAILASGGAEPHHLVRLTWYVVDMDEYLANLREPLQHGAAGIAAISLFTKISNLQQLSTLERP